MSGTSMACPHVTGTAALILAKNPTVSPDDLKSILQKTALKTAGMNGWYWTSAYGFGRVDAYAAVSAAQTLPPGFSLSASPSSLTIQQGGSGSSTVTVTSQNGFNSAVTLSASGGPAGVIASFSLNPVTPPFGGSATSTLTINVDSSTSTGTYTLTVTGVSGSLTHSTILTLAVTSPPTIALSVEVTTDNPTYKRKSFAVIIVTVAANSNPVIGASVTITVTDPKGRTMGDFGTTDAEGRVTFKYRIGPNAPLGTYSVIVQAFATGFNPGIGLTIFIVGK